MAGLPTTLKRFVLLVRRYLQLREDQRYTFEQITWEWKLAWTDLETQTGVKLRFLDVDEADGVLSKRLALDAAQALVERREEAHAAETLRWRKGDAPPAFLGEHSLPPGLGRRMRGRGISRGIARGPARVAHRLQDAHALRPGEILVTRATDPGWTPLFRTAAGLVLEQGGMLSHGAVVAREYGLPGVVNVVNATRRIETGQVLTIDGARGLVILD
jgi:pyruvate,water dikinase